MATRAFLILLLLCFSTGCRPIMRALFRSAARSAVRTAVAASSEPEEDELTLEESMQQLAMAIEEAFVEPGEPMTFEQFASFNDGQACVLFVKAPYAKVARAYAELAEVELESSELTNVYGVVDHAVVALNDCQWTLIYHSLGGSLWFDETTALAKRLKTRVFEYECDDDLCSLYSVQPDGKKIRFATEDDLEWAMEIAEDQGKEPPKAKVIDSYTNMLAHYEIEPLVFTYNEEGTLVLMPNEEERVKRVMAMP